MWKVTVYGGQDEILYTWESDYEESANSYAQRCLTKGFVVREWPKNTFYPPSRIDRIVVEKTDGE